MMSIAPPNGRKETDNRMRILVVDDDAEMRALLADVLGDEGYSVEGVPDGAEALIRLRTESFRAIVLDKNMPGLSGLDLLPGLRTICPETPVILITAFGDVSTYMNAMEKGAFELLFKPFRMRELLRALRRALPSGTEASFLPPGPRGPA
jgi:DNA-binding NtrC family response regulator